MRLVFFDVETTGFDPVLDRIIEIALLVVEDGKVKVRLDKFIKQDVVVSDEVKDLTGISNELLDELGDSEEFVAGMVRDLLVEGSLMIAHNCQFDLGFLYQLLCRYYAVSEVDGLFESMEWLDTLTVFRDRKGYPHKLVDMCEYYNIGDVRFHRALDDTVALSKCVKALNRERNDLVSYFNVFGFNPKYGVSGEEFSFIRYVPQKYNRGLVGKDFILPLL